MDNNFNPGRRRFLKTGLAGAAVLAVAAWWVRPDSQKCKDCLWLQASDRALLLALVPVMLAGALPGSQNERTQAINEIISGFDTTVAHFPPTVRAEIRQLLWLLKFPVTRILLAGVWSPWHKAESKEIADFMANWQHARFDLLRVGYAALHDLIMGVWYANPLSWQRIHYPGPPALS